MDCLCFFADTEIMPFFKRKEINSSINMKKRVIPGF